jgi:hypothetical protein
VSFAMAVDAGQVGQVGWASDAESGLRSWGFSTLADSDLHVYNIPVVDARNAQGLTWRGRTSHITLEPAQGTSCRVRLRWLRVGAAPSGPPEVQVDQFLITDPLPRPGRPLQVSARLSKRGGTPLSRLHASLVLPPGARLCAGEHKSVLVRDLQCLKPETVLWRICADRPGPLTLRLRIRGDVSHDLVTTETILPPAPVPAGDYVPQPQPVRGDYDVGVYYFPGWWNWDRWLPITDFPECRPVLGWYREGFPEVADWHIKWAVEHGVTFFCYDWYWDRGPQWLTYAFHDGYFCARYKDYASASCGPITRRRCTPPRTMSKSASTG